MIVVMHSTHNVQGSSLRSPIDAKHLEQIRNRENQRRLRKRRQAYVEELEAQLRTLKRDGVRASESVQHAARIVVEENRLLRRLLEGHGLFKSEVDNYIRDAMTDAPAPTPALHETHPASNTFPRIHQHHSVVSIARDTSDRIPTIAMEDSSPPPATIKNHSRWTIELEQPAPRIEAVSVVKSPANSSLESRQILESPVSVSAVRSKNPASPTACDRDTIDAMDCEKAAHIITSLRGGGNPEDVWPELGCSGAHRTSVKNMHIMSLAG